MEPKRRGPLLWIAARTRRFWIGTALALPFLYMASIGPGMWLTNKYPKQLSAFFLRYHGPSQFLYEVSPRPVQRAFESYINSFPNDQMKKIGRAPDGSLLPPPPPPVR